MIDINAIAAKIADAWSTSKSGERLFDAACSVLHNEIDEKYWSRTEGRETEQRISCKGSPSLGTACGECAKCRAIPSSVWAEAIRWLRSSADIRVLELKRIHSQELSDLRVRTEENTVNQMLGTAVNCGHSSVCAVAGWFRDEINKRKLDQDRVIDD